MIGSTKFRKLLEPSYVGSIRTRNRLLKTGSTLGFYPWEDGNIQQKVIDSYEVLAKGGAGIVTVGAAMVAALRGHEVILYEKERKLGGSMPMVRKL